MINFILRAHIAWVYLKDMIKAGWSRATSKSAINSMAFWALMILSGLAGAVVALTFIGWLIVISYEWNA